MIAIIDYGLGNLYSLSRSLEYIGLEAKITRDVQEIERADKLILPGVGAFRDAIRLLTEKNLTDVIHRQTEKGVPMMGICLGMQLLFDVSYEYGEYEGLSLIPGRVCPIEADLTAPLKVPHIGWNSLHIEKDCALTQDVSEGEFVYFVHSYYAKDCAPAICATAQYNVTVPGIVQKGNVFGCQFHPEKSGDTGLRILRAFGRLA